MAARLGIFRVVWELVKNITSSLLEQYGHWKSWAISHKQIELQTENDQLAAGGF